MRRREGEINCHWVGEVLGGGVASAVILTPVGNSLLIWVARLDDGAELKVTDPKEQQRDVEEEEAEDKERQKWIDCWRRGAGC